MGSAAAGSFIAHLVFWTLVIWGLVTREMSARAAALVVTLYFGAMVGLDYLPYGPSVFPSIVAVIDIVLVFVLFKGDVHLT
jgi:hypothetical protein